MKFISSILLLTACSGLFAQENVQEEPKITSKFPKFIIAYNVSSMLYKEYSGNIEYFFNKNKSLSIEGGYIKNLYSFYSDNIFSHIPLFLHEGMVGRLAYLNYNYNKSAKNPFYHGPKLIGRWQWNDYITYDPCASAGTFSCIGYHQSEKMWMLAFQYLIGKKYFIKSFVIDLYAGGGWYHKQRKIHIFESFPASNSNMITNEDKNSTEISVFPSGSLGIRVGFRF